MLVIIFPCTMCHADSKVGVIIWHVITTNLALLALFFSPWGTWSFLVTYWTIQEGWTHYPWFTEGGSIFWYLYCFGSPRTQQPASASYSGSVKRTRVINPNFELWNVGISLIVYTVCNFRLQQRQFTIFCLRHPPYHAATLILGSLADWEEGSSRQISGKV